MFKMLALLILSILDASFLYFFVKWSKKQEAKLTSILDEYKAIKKSTDSYLLRTDVQKKVKEFDAYFEKVFKTLDESKHHLVNQRIEE